MEDLISRDCTLFRPKEPSFSQDFVRITMAHCCQWRRLAGSPSPASLGSCVAPGLGGAVPTGCLKPAPPSP
eukprot:968441-Pyramimonas_sp.AAC.1